ncbi:hypothetical protein NX794_13655 [Streptomyces sp. LP11]|uniref:Uncharacterized protein n=1 Tax=Streptomyces pyxinicus TaxID=2970331 RepID=A0ABT2B157_9ACTN|nr:hypothetical protein [Streptomyces sp. LP11]MCS0602244.1 hypothetical protein [Streptomyces sp. LP11]
MTQSTEANPAIRSTRLLQSAKILPPISTVAEVTWQVQTRFPAITELTFARTNDHTAWTRVYSRLSEAEFPVSRAHGEALSAVDDKAIDDTAVEAILSGPGTERCRAGRGIGQGEGSGGSGMRSRMTSTSVVAGHDGRPVECGAAEPSLAG